MRHLQSKMYPRSLLVDCCSQRMTLTESRPYRESRLMESLWKAYGKHISCNFKVQLVMAIYLAKVNLVCPPLEYKVMSLFLGSLTGKRRTSGLKTMCC